MIHSEMFAGRPSSNASLVMFVRDASNCTALTLASVNVITTTLPKLSNAGVSDEVGPSVGDPDGGDVFGLCVVNPVVSG